MLGQPDVWKVSHGLAHAEYRVELQTGTCPHFVERCAPRGETCKHFELIDLMLLTSHQRPQPEPVPARKSTWSELSNICDF